ncbi:BglG family transcription antiterminator [Macrococcus capreoli]|uniref:BglG family transcription antiterminator n=1 Tax=Macrococcus capreoli TaxID=2982690 RepID=UPI0021D5D8FA|nr:PTS sugar transporter subunit IIA [Macrococcus sp. TMW 2.2395]MCU7558210.1 PTS sugar transporter subunit IIA [Macrococcus sp. TMW 2.2395]
MQISELNLKILDLLKKQQSIAQRDLYYQLNITNKKLKYELDKIVDDFNIHVTKTSVYIDDIDLLNSTLSKIQYHDLIFSEDERINILLFYLLIKHDYISIEHLIDVGNVSRNTILQDIKILKEQIRNLNGAIEYSRSNGYELIMNAEDRDLLFINLVHQIAPKHYAKYLMKFISNNDFDSNNLYNDDIGIIEAQLGHAFSDNHRKAIQFALYIIDSGYYESRLSKSQLEIKSKQFESENHIKGFHPLIVLMMQSTNVFLDESRLSDKQTDQLLLNFVQTFEILSGIIIMNKDKLIHQLKRHYYPAVLRAKYGINTVVNTESLVQPSMKPIITFTKRAIKDLESSLNIQFSENEIVLWSLYFAGVTRNQGNIVTPHEIAIVACPNGMAISHSLTQKLKMHFPTLIFLEPTSISQVHEKKDQVDIIFSTHAIQIDKPVYLITESLSIHELEYLNEKLNMTMTIPFEPKYSMNDLMDVIKEHADIKNEKNLYEAISQLLKPKHHFKEGYQPMLKELLTESFIQTELTVDNWQDSIIKASKPLLTNNIITEDYIKAMINSVIELGPYIVIMPDIAIPHARPEDGALEVGLSFANFKEPVVFPNDKSVKAMIVLSAKDQNAHLKALAEMTEILGNDNYVEILKTATDKNEIIKLINEIK